MPNVRRLHADDIITEAIVRRTLTAWAARDVDGTVACMAEDIVHVFNVDAAVIPFAKTVHGKAQLKPQLQLLLDTFDFNLFVIDGLKVQDAKATARVSIDYTHKLTGERLQTKFRMVFEQRNGLVARMDEHHDATFVEAFMRLVASPPQN